MDDATTREPRASGQATILVVDDQATLLLVLSTMLKRAGYQPLTATSSQDALTLFQRHADAIRLVLLDLHLPADSTAELFDALRALRPDLPVILMSGIPGHVALDRLAKDGVRGFLYKPFSPGELTRAIETALYGSGAPVGSAIPETTVDGRLRTSPPDALPAREPPPRRTTS